MGWKDFARDTSEIVEMVSNSVLSNNRDQSTVIASKILFRLSVLIGRWFSEIFDENKTDNFTFISELEISEILNGILSFHRNNFRANINSRDATTLLLSVVIYCSQSADDKYNKLISEKFIRYDVIYDYHFPLIWTNLYQKGFFEKCGEMINNLIKENGKIWELNNENKEDIISNLLVITKNTQYNNIVNEAHNKLQWYTITFSGHKDYNLHYEIIWLEEVLKKKPELWRTEGIKLLNLSEKASLLGDNRASNSVNKLIMFSAIKSNPSDAFLLYTHIKINYEHWRSYLTDALIDYYDQYELNEEKIKIIWLFFCGYLHWSQYDDRKDIFRLKKTILDSQLAKANPQIPSFIEETNPIYFNIDKLNKIDENEYHSKSDISGSIESNIEIFFSSETKDYELLAAIIKKISMERPPNFNEVLNTIYRFLLDEQERTFWGNNRYGKVYKEIIPLLTEEKKWEIGANIVNAFYKFDEFENFYSFSENLNYFCLYMNLTKIESIIDGYNRILQMHNEWIKGFSDNTSDINKDCINYSDLSINISTWPEFAFQVLLEKLKSRSGIETENSLQAIWQIIKYSPDIIDFIDNIWLSLSEDPKEYLLMLFELIPYKFEKYIPNIKSILNKVYQGNSYSLKIQAYIVYSAINRVIGEEVPKIPLKNNEFWDAKNNIDYPFISILEVDSSEKEHFSAIINHHHLFKRKIEFLEAVTNYDLKQYFNEKLSYLITLKPIYKEINTKSNLRGDFHISSRVADDLFNSMFEQELVNGNFKEFPLITITQALIVNDDPYTCEHKYIPAKNLLTWPEERGEINNPEEVLFNLLNEGITDENILLSGEIRLYNHIKEFRGILNSYYVPKSEFILKYRDSSTFNARSIFLYSKHSYQQNSPENSLFTIAGGISKLLYSNNWIIPSRVLFALSNWEINKRNPYLIEYDNKKVAWLEKYFGPITTVDVRYDRQSAIQRWLCKKTDYGEMLKNLKESFEIRIKFKHEVFDLDK